jgi:hypothetical protein
MAQKTNYDYGIRVLRSRPPESEVFPFVARLTHFVRQEGGRQYEVNVHFDEVFARTENEAREKLRKKIEGWIAASETRPLS